jgi:Lung seven transmembrane receptor
LAENATERSNNMIYTEAVHLKDPGQPVNYEIKKTGYFCVGSAGYTPEGIEYIATVEFRNAFGELPAAQIAKLPFYGGLTIVYAVVGV